MNANDPRITAYALGELNAAEQAEVQAALAADPTLAAEVEDIRRLAGRLKQALANGHDAASSSTRQAVEAALIGGNDAPEPANASSEESPEPLRPQPGSRRKLGVIAVLATTIAACVGGLIWFNTQQAGPEQSPHAVSHTDPDGSFRQAGRGRESGGFASTPPPQSMAPHMESDRDDNFRFESGRVKLLFDESRSMSGANDLRYRPGLDAYSATPTDESTPGEGRTRFGIGELCERPGRI